MKKKIIINLDDEIFEVFKSAADNEERTLPNSIINAALEYILSSDYVDEEEMKSISNDKELINNFKRGLKNISDGKFKIIQ